MITRDDLQRIITTVSMMRAARSETQLTYTESVIRELEASIDEWVTANLNSGPELVASLTENELQSVKEMVEALTERVRAPYPRTDARLSLRAADERAQRIASEEHRQLRYVIARLTARGEAWGPMGLEQRHYWAGVRL